MLPLPLLAWGLALSHATRVSVQSVQRKVVFATLLRGGVVRILPPLPLPPQDLAAGNVRQPGNGSRYCARFCTRKKLHGPAARPHAGATLARTR